MTSFQKNLLLDTLEKHKQFGYVFLDSIDIERKFSIENQLPSDINELEDYVNNCSLCELSKHTKECFLGTGDPQSWLYIIVTNKYQLNDPNISSMLKNMVEKVLDIKFSESYLISLIKCTTPKHHKDLGKEIDICLSYTKKQLSITKPKMILTFGDAYRYLLDSNEKLLDVAGNVYNYDGSKLIPLIHPEFIFKNPSYKEYAFNNLKKVKTIMESI